MKFAYTSIISVDHGTGDFLLLRRPEIPVTIVGPRGSATYLGLVDTGSDNTIFPRTVADHLGILVQSVAGPSASVFGGHRVQLLTGEAILQLESDGKTFVWKVSVCFYEFPSDEDETVILGHASFLDYFTTTFDGKLGFVSMDPNDDLPPGV